MRTFATRVLIGLLVLFLAPLAGQTLAQKKGRKEAEKFRQQTEATRKAVEEVRDQLKQTLDLYNGLFGEEKAKKLSGNYDKVAKSLEATDKKVESGRKSVENMKKGAEKFFESWAAEIEGLSSAGLQEKSTARMETVRAKYDGMLEAMGEARELYDPFFTTLSEQVMYLGRDLTPETLSDLEGEAKTLNEDAEALFAKIEEILTGETEGEKEVEAIIAEDEAELPAEMTDDEMPAEDAAADEEPSR